MQGDEQINNNHVGTDQDSFCKILYMYMYFLAGSLNKYHHFYTVIFKIKLHIN